MIKKYYQLTKPGIIRGNLVPAIAGFLLASQGQVNWRLGAAMLIGLSLIIASACVFNNYIDRDIDRRMARTKERALVTGDISGPSALIYATILGLLGSLTLVLFTNLLTLLLALFGLFAYVVFYGWGKRNTLHSTLIGSISGAVPPVVGYAAVTGALDNAAVLLFLILVAWQMPHFYGIALYRLQDYKSAKLPVLPAKKGARTAQIQIMLYIIIFAAAATALATGGYAGKGYLIVALALSAGWFGLGLSGFRTQEPKLWGRKMFFFSLIVITGLCLAISVDASIS